MKSTKTIGSRPAATKMPKAAAVNVALGKSAKPAIKAGGMKLGKGKRGC